MVTWVPRESWCAPHLTATRGRRRGIVCSHRDTWLCDLGKRRSPIKNWTGQKAKQVPASGVMRIQNLVRAAFPFPVVTNISKNKVTLRGLKLFFPPHKGNITEKTATGRDPCPRGPVCPASPLRAFSDLLASSKGFRCLYTTRLWAGQNSATPKLISLFRVFIFCPRTHHFLGELTLEMLFSPEKPFSAPGRHWPYQTKEVVI